MCYVYITLKAIYIKSFDGVTWSKYDVEDVIELPKVGDCVYFAAGEGGNKTFGIFNGNINRSRFYFFVIGGLVAASGDIRSILDFDIRQTELGNACFLGMFRNCTGLTTAPDLPESSLTERCYSYMFSGCVNLKSIKVRFVDAWGFSTLNWFENASSTGIFYKPNALPEEYGKDKIPTGWKVINID